MICYYFNRKLDWIPLFVLFGSHVDNTVYKFLLVPALPLFWYTKIEAIVKVISLYHIIYAMIMHELIVSPSYYNRLVQISSSKYTLS